MSDVTTQPGSPSTQTARCPACGHPTDRLVRGRCSLCHYQIEDEPVTAADATPYAQCPRPTRRDRRRMLWWTWSAGAGRLSHLSLMQVSPAARHFARKNLNGVILTGALCWLTLTGWHAVRALPVEAGGQPPAPAGYGWLRLAASPGPVPAGDPTRVIAWWWNPPLASAGALVALILGLLISRLLLRILRRGVESALLPKYRGQQRLSAALHYATAWLYPLIPAGLVLAVSPLCGLAAVADWPVQVPVTAAYSLAALLGGAAGIMVWFGLIRLAATVPVRSRTRVVVFCAVGMPLIAAALVGGPAWGLWWLQTRHLTAWLQLQW